MPIPGVAAHDAVFAVLRGRLQRRRELVGPAVLVDRLGDVGDQARAGEEAGRRVALVELHEVGSGVGVEHLAGRLLDLLEGLLLELDGRAGLFFEDLDGFGPGLAHGAVGAFVVPELQGVAGLGAAGRSAGAAGEREARDRQRADESDSSLGVGANGACHQWHSFLGDPHWSGQVGGWCSVCRSASMTVHGKARRGGLGISGCPSLRGRSVAVATDPCAE